MDNTDAGYALLTRTCKRSDGHSGRYKRIYFFGRKIGDMVGELPVLLE